MRISTIVAVVVFSVALVMPARGQLVGVYVGPQISGHGIGASAQVKFTQFSGSAEFGIVPINNITLDSDDIEYTIDTRMKGALLMANFHPGFFGMTIGGGLLLGGYNASADSEQLEGQVEIGDGMYDASEIGVLLGEFDFGGPAPAIMIGRRSGGLNIGIGVALTGSPTLQLTATGPIADDPQFQAELERERQSAQAELDNIPVMPLVRVGWQFGLGI